MKTLPFLHSLARRRLFSIVLVGLLSFGGSWAISLCRGIPIPYINDEFSYLLAGDTFAHGRLTNPTHPMWRFFESFHILQYPTTMSRYPPGQGLFLALGQVILGHPIFGVWLSTALMCCAICWMLYAWVSPLWALVGGLVGVLQFGVFTYWSQSYFGGAVAAMGGALIFGALPRIFKKQRVADALILGLGIAVVLNTRPLEGLVLIPAGCLLLPWKIKDKEFKLPCFLKKIVLPVLLFLLITLMGIFVYNKQITGHPFTFPHRLYAATYSSVPLMSWQKMGPPIKFNNKEMERQEKDWLEKYFLYKKTWNGFFEDMKNDGKCIYNFYFGNLLGTMGFFMAVILYLRRGRCFSLIFVIFAFLFCFAAAYCLFRPHYCSALTCLAVFFAVEGLRFMSLLRIRRWRLGLMLVILLIGFQFIDHLAQCSPSQPEFSSARVIHSPLKDLPGKFTREELKNILLKRGGKYLVIVKYLPWHMYYWEWVYNDADIDRSPIVWARDLGNNQEASLLAYFKDRQVISIEVVWDLCPGQIKKKDFLRIYPDGQEILSRLIKSHMLENISPSAVRLNLGVDLKRQEVCKIAGYHCRMIWAMLQRSKNDQIPDFRRINL